MSGQKSNFEDIARRRNQVALILQECQEDNKKPKNSEILSKLKESGFEIDERTLQRDLDFIESNDDFVIRVATTSHSYFIKECFRKLDDAESSLYDIRKKTWTMSKKIKRTSDDGDSEESVVTSELAAPKIAANKLIAEIQKMKIEALNGKLLDDSTALMLKEFQNLKRKLDVLEEESQSLREENENLKKGATQIAS